MRLCTAGYKQSMIMRMLEQDRGLTLQVQKTIMRGVVMGEILTFLSVKLHDSHDEHMITVNRPK